MICDALKRLSEFHSLDNYRYIGFGAIYFTDFLLFHKELGISKMISIESDIAKKDRYEFNRPLNCINIEYGSSTEVLPRINWNENKPDIIWLDYDDSFKSYMLDDLEYILANLLSGSIFIMTCNGSIAKEGTRLDYLNNKFGNKVPLNVTEVDLTPNKSHAVIRKMMNGVINRALNERNAGEKKQLKYIYEQLFNFTYKDGAPMVTIGGVVFQEKDRDTYIKCKFSDLNFLTNKNEDNPYDIEMPCLTFKEISKINKKLPCTDPTDIIISGVSEKDINNYIKLYKYFPYYMEIQSFN